MSRKSKLRLNTPRLRLSQELQNLAVQFADQPVHLGQILDAAKGRGFNILLIILSLPFVTPLPLPGLSMPFGLLALAIGGRMALGQKPWLPSKLLAFELSPGFFAKLIRTAGRLLRAMEWLLRPRLPFLHEPFVMRRLNGILIALSGLFLVLPLPIPFSNGLPALTILLLSAAALERDGLCLIVGFLAFGCTAAFFVLLAMGGKEVIEHLPSVLRK